MDILKFLNPMDNNINTNIFLLVIGISLLSLLENKTILCIILIVLLFLTITIPSISSDNRKKDIRKDIRKDKISDDMNYNKDINDLLLDIKKFNKYNKVSYKEGVKYLRKFFKTIHILEHDDIMNPNQYYDNALLYLKTSINHFQSITISLPERGYINALKYGDFEATKKVNKLGNICKKLYNECYYILLNLSIKYNKQWRDNPNIYTKEIDINHDRTEEYNKYTIDNWSLY